MMHYHVSLYNFGMDMSYRLLRQHFAVIYCHMVELVGDLGHSLGKADIRLSYFGDQE